jgi:uncharacterized membrane protein YqjE
MREQTKSIITRRDIHERLNNRFRASLPGLIVVLIFMLLMNLFLLADNWICYTFAILCDMMAVAIVVAVIDGIRRLHRTESNDFMIVEDELTDMREELEYTGRHHRLIYVRYFRNYGSYRLNTAWDGSVWSYSSLGDRFYLVVSKNGSIRLVYSKKIYEVKP